eukprot:TRINITY_DN2963_c0_g1_i2.p1 TRINITY_DN2963_c0_g1~~TRINITY_DN2963_c0_g1_i2.p1  ORF type:complete len:389 (-),score=87.51 TRINITY_DN2963_c0_g1_i2:43-1209(-)
MTWPAYCAQLTSLHIAAIFGNHKIIQLLLQKGADYTATEAWDGDKTRSGKWNRSPADYARMAGFPDIAAALDKFREEREEESARGTPPQKPALKLKDTQAESVQMSAEKEKESLFAKAQRTARQNAERLRGSRPLSPSRATEQSPLQPPELAALAYNHTHTLKSVSAVKPLKPALSMSSSVASNISVMTFSDLESLPPTSPVDRGDKSERKKRGIRFSDADISQEDSDPGSFRPIPTPPSASPPPSPPRTAPSLAPPPAAAPAAPAAPNVQHSQPTQPSHSSPPFAPGAVEEDTGPCTCAEPEENKWIKGRCLNCNKTLGTPPLSEKSLKRTSRHFSDAREFAPVLAHVAALEQQLREQREAFTAEIASLKEQVARLTAALEQRGAAP